MRKVVTQHQPNMLVKVAIYLFAIYHLEVSGQSQNGGDFANFKCDRPKFGTCPSTLINPSSYECTTDRECGGGRRCCAAETEESSADFQVKYCSDIDGSKRHLTCPARPLFVPGSSIQNGTKCYTDANCGNGNLKCCVGNSYEDCDSYCVAGVENCFNIPNKPEGLCPSIEWPKATIYCSSNNQCPGNWVCCDGKAGKKCSPPRTLSLGTCPAPHELLTAGAKRCFSDKDCGVRDVCCKFDNCNYFCSEDVFFRRLKIKIKVKI